VHSTLEFTLRIGKRWRTLDPALVYWGVVRGGWCVVGGARCALTLDDGGDAFRVEVRFTGCEVTHFNSFEDNRQQTWSLTLCVDRCIQSSRSRQGVRGQDYGSG